RAQVIGIDLNQADLAEAERVRKVAKLQNLAFLRCDLQDLIAVNIFDLIISFEVLEYIRDEKSTLQQLYASLRPGGGLLLHVIDAEGGYRQSGARRILNRQTGAWRDTGMLRAGYAACDLSVELQRAGFVDVSVQPTFGAIGMLAHTWFEVGRTWPTPLYLLLFPFLVALAHWDTRAQKTSGGAMLATSWKE